MIIVAYRTKSVMAFICGLIAIACILVGDKGDLVKEIGFAFILASFIFLLHSKYRSKFDMKYRSEFFIKMYDEKLCWGLFDSVYFGCIDDVSLVGNKLILSNAGAGYRFQIFEDQEKTIKEFKVKLDRYRKSVKICTTYC